VESPAQLLASESANHRNEQYFVAREVFRHQSDTLRRLALDVGASRRQRDYRVVARWLLYTDVVALAQGCYWHSFTVDGSAAFAAAMG
jgi:hypothetical protein